MRGERAPVLTGPGVEEKARTRKSGCGPRLCERAGKFPSRPADGGGP